jgi:tetratricopeptide (TPR) repeat protein
MLLSWASRPPEQLVTALLICASAVAGLIFCIRASGRKRTNTKAALALAALLGSLAIISGSFAAIGSQLTPLPVIIISMLVFAAVVIGLVLAVLAFIELRRDMIGATEGRLMAWISLGLAPLAMLVVGLALQQVVSDILQPRGGLPALAAATSTPSPEPATALAPATQPAEPATQPIASIGAAKRPMAYPFKHAADSVAMEHLNYIIEHPGKIWTRKPPNVAGEVGFSRMFPFMIFEANAEAFGDDISTEELADNASRTESADVTVFEVLDRRPMIVNGVPGIQLKKRFVFRGREQFAVHWTSAFRGYVYNLLLFGHSDDERKITEAVPEMFKKFYVLDPSRIVRVPEARPLQHESTRFSYRFEIKRPRWELEADVRKVHGSAEFGAFSPEASVIIFPAFLFGVNPEMDVLADGLLHSLNMRFAQTKLLGKSTEGEAEVYTFEFQEPAPQKRIWHFKCIKRGDLAYLVVATTLTESRRGDLPKILEGFALTPIAARLNPIEFSPTEKRISSIFLNSLGLRYSSDANVERAALCFNKAMEMVADPVIAENLANTYITGKQYQKAILSINRDIGNIRNSEKLRSLLGLAQSLSGDSEAALATFKALFAGNFQEDRAFDLYLSLLNKVEGPAAAVAAGERYLRRFDSIDITIAVATIQSEAGQHARAVELLTQKQKGIGFNPMLTYALAEAHMAAGQSEEVFAVVKKLRSSGQDTAYTDQLQGRAEVALRRYKEAKTSFEAALKKDPQFASANEWLKHVTTILGKGDTTNIREPIEAVAVPADLLKDFSAPAPASAKDSSAYIAHRVIAISFIPGKDQRETVYNLIKVLDTNAVRNFNTMDFSFDPLAESIYVNKLVVRDGDGKVAAEGKPEDYYTLDEGGEAASQEKRLHVTIPGLKPGYSIELVVTRRDHARPEKPRFKSLPLAGAYPCIGSAVVLKGDPNLFNIRPTEGVIERKIEGGVCWTLADPPAIRNEQYALPIDEYIPRVALADRSAQWPQEAREYIGTLAPRLLPSPAIKALAQRLTEGLTTDQQKAAAILKHVQGEFTYKAISFGPRARMPQSVEDIVQNRYGDCKDHSLLLHHLLTSAGISSSLTLVKAYGDIIPDVPSMDQFDHMIVYSPHLDQFFDCTTKDLDLARYTPYTLGGSHALVLDLLQPRLMKIPSPTASAMDLTRELRISENGELLVHDVVRLTGYVSSGFRSYLRGGEPKRRAEYMQRFVGSGGRDAVKAELKIENLEEVDRPLVIDMTYVLPDTFRRNGAQLVGTLPAQWDRFYLDAQHLEKRETPFELKIPVACKSTVSIYLPDHYRLRNLPNDLAASDDFISAQLGFSQVEQLVKLQSTWTLKTGRYPAARYSAFQKAMTNITSGLEQTLVLEK